MMDLSNASEMGTNLRSIDALLKDIKETFDDSETSDIELMRKSMMHHIENGNMDKALYESRVLRDHLIDLTTE